MTENNPQGDEEMAPYTILTGRAQAAKPAEVAEKS
jgi:hypothetical protein